MSGITWILFLGGAFVLFLSFIWDYSAYVLMHKTPQQIVSHLGDETLLDLAFQYVPGDFNWILFMGGELIVIAGLIYFYKKNKKV